MRWSHPQRLQLVLSLPLLLFAFYGMNVQLPFASHPHTWKWLVAAAVTWAALALTLTR